MEDKGEISAGGIEVTKMLQNIEDELGWWLLDDTGEKKSCGSERSNVVWYSASVVCAQLRVETFEALAVAGSAVSRMTFSPSHQPFPPSPPFSMACCFGLRIGLILSCLCCSVSVASWPNMDTLHCKWELLSRAPREFFLVNVENMIVPTALYEPFTSLTLILLTWRIWRAPNNASRWQVEFNWAFKWLKKYNH